MATGEIEGARIAGDGGSLFRLSPPLSAVAFRQKLLEAVVCGGGGISRRRSVESKRSSRLADLLKAEISSESAASALKESEKEKNRKLRFLEQLQSAVGNLQLGDDSKKKEAAMEVRRLAKDNAEARETLAMLGAIPPLAGMIDSDDAELKIESLYALLNLGIGNDANKAAIMEAGAAQKMLDLIESGSSRALSEAIVANFLGLSALDSNKAVIGASARAAAFLVGAFRNAEARSQIRLDSLRSLYNLSVLPSNAPSLVESDELVPALFGAVGDAEVSENALSVLSNLVGSPEGRTALSRCRGAIPILVDVLGWCDSPGCQEKAAYVLMIMAHKGCRDRAAMMEAGVVSPLLELTLMGSALAQKRASRILEVVRADKGKQVSEGFAASGTAPVLCWGPREGGWAGEGPAGGGGPAVSRERRAVNELVRQSLQSNMARIVRRANLALDFAPSGRLVAVPGPAATSKSLPF